MELVSSETVSILVFLLPGFVAAAVFYWLTSHPKPGAFERIVQALIFTILVQAMVKILVIVMERRGWALSWDEAERLIFSTLAAIGLGLLAVFTLNKDIPHRFLRRIGFTRENSYPSEWYSAFDRHADCYLVLHLKGERRLYGWPTEWPSRPDEGHFLIEEVEWLDGDERIPAEGVAGMVVSASEVEMVEFLAKTASNELKE
ncbi:MAG: hypothetical protein F4X91_15195 [Nitrospinae bacterium]|nr:hypothetical protein [Nitrospinota bacterium]